MRTTWLVIRVLLGIGGGYAASAAVSAALAVVLCRVAGFDRGESTVLCAMLGFAFYLFALLWAFTTPKLSHVAWVLVGGSLFGYGVVHWMSEPIAAMSLMPLVVSGMGGILG
jgi:hypothetical protein